MQELKDSGVAMVRGIQGRPDWSAEQRLRKAPGFEGR